MKLIAFAVRVALISAVIVISPGTTSAITVQDVPASRPHSWVTDSINILSPQTEAEINRLVDQLEAKNSCEIMVVTVPETKGYM
ncbi:MAG: TPM domain-containing protein [Phormidesmis sp. CAN_BIN44]|nr:TPM domain-containing protein [Phormidesmis sp. CAN_BIN44]